MDRRDLRLRQLFFSLIFTMTACQGAGEATKDRDSSNLGGDGTAVVEPAVVEPFGLKALTGVWRGEGTADPGNIWDISYGGGWSGSGKPQKCVVEASFKFKNQGKSFRVEKFKMSFPEIRSLDWYSAEVVNARDLEITPSSNQVLLYTSKQGNGTLDPSTKMFELSLNSPWKGFFPGGAYSNEGSTSSIKIAQTADGSFKLDFQILTIGGSYQNNTYSALCQNVQFKKVQDAEVNPGDLPPLSPEEIEREMQFYRNYLVKRGMSDEKYHQLRERLRLSSGRDPLESFRDTGGVFMHGTQDDERSYLLLSVAVLESLRRRNPGPDQLQEYLRYAILRNDEKVVNGLLELGAPVNAMDAESHSPLHTAAVDLFFFGTRAKNEQDKVDFEKASIHYTELMIRRGADPFLRDGNGESVIQSVVNERNWDGAELISRMTGKPLTVHASESTLYDIILKVDAQATQESRHAEIERMMKLGVIRPYSGSESPDRSKATLIFVQAFWQIGRLDRSWKRKSDPKLPLYEQIADIYLPYVDIQVGHPSGASRRLSRDILHLMFDQDLDRSYGSSNEVFLKAIRKYVSALIRAGADINGKDADGSTPFANCLEHLGKQEYCFQLLDLGADPNIADHRGLAPIHYLSFPTGLNPLIEKLVSHPTHPADPNLASENGETWFLAMAPSYFYRGSYPTVERMKANLETAVKLGANPKATLNNGQNYLHLATRLDSKMAKEFEPVLKYVISLGVDLNAKDQSGKMPLDLMKKRIEELRSSTDARERESVPDFEEFAKLLQKYGAKTAAGSA